MKKTTNIFLAAVFLLNSCSPIMKGVVNTTEPEMISDSREIISVNDYIISDQNKFNVSIQREEEVKYSTTYEETQKWHDPNPYSTYLIGGIGSAGLSYLSFKGIEKGENNSLNYVFGITMGIVSIMFFNYAIKNPVNYNKTITKEGKPFYSMEWVKASYENINISIDNESNSYQTNYSGLVKIDPNDYQFPVLIDHQDFDVNFNKSGKNSFGSVLINSSWWMSNYGVINSSPVGLMGDLNSYPVKLFDMQGEGSTVLDKKDGFYLLNLKNSNAWIKPKYLNVFYYS